MAVKLPTDEKVRRQLLEAMTKINDNQSILVIAAGKRYVLKPKKDVKY